MDITRYEPADILIYIKDRGVVLTEKSLVAVHADMKKIVAIGNEAEEIAEKNLPHVQVFSPLRQGMVADYMAAVSLFSALLRNAWGKKPLRRPPVAICVPTDTTDVEKKAIQDVIYQAGAREILISDVPFHQFIREFPEEMPKLYQKFSTIIGITKDEPEKYITEHLAHVIWYAQKEGISLSRVGELLQKLSE